MSLYILNDTICALSTPSGKGAIAVIRISGPLAFTVIAKIFRTPGRGFSPNDVPTHTIHFGYLNKGNKILDEVLVSIFRKPHSYTGEDVAEISCHGSLFIQQKVLETIISEGIRLAKPGEFTFRAFLNGKMDLSQAEAVADLIAAQSESSHDLAMDQVRGGFAIEIKRMREKLVEFTSLIELELDFSEEQVEFADRTSLLNLLYEIRDETSSMIESFRLGNVIRNGIPVAIIGKPNVGKSTLLNAILNEERAIVSELPGTTRDTIEDTIVIEGYSFRFIDTAGLRQSEDTLESMGIERTWQKIKEASIVLYVFDVTAQTYDEVKEDMNGLRGMTDITSKHLILVGNKTDMLEELPSHFSDFVDEETVFVSARRKENIHLLAESLRRKVIMADIQDRTLISNTRHHEALIRTLAAIESVILGLKDGLPSDLLTIDIRTALHYLGEISGEITTEEILGNIFGKFCIGK